MLLFLLCALQIQCFLLWPTFHPCRYTRSNSVWSFVILTTLDSDVLFCCGAYFIIYLVLWVSIYLCWRISGSPDHSFLCWNRARQRHRRIYMTIYTFFTVIITWILTRYVLLLVFRKQNPNCGATVPNVISGILFQGGVNHWVPSSVLYMLS